MLYLAGVRIPDNKPVYLGLTYIFGIGEKTAKIICNKQNITSYYKISQLTQNQITNLIQELRNYTIEENLKKVNENNIKRLIDIGSYKGFRHSLALPVHGQRTRSNAKTQRKLGSRFSFSTKKHSVKKPHIKKPLQKKIIKKPVKKK